MASGSITSPQTDGETMETVTDFIFLAPVSLQKVTAAMKLKDTRSLEVKLLTNLDSVLKNRDITLPTKVHMVKAMVFPGWGRSPGEGNSNPLQHSCLENPTDRGAWQATVHGIARVRHDLATKSPHYHVWI